MGQAAVSRQTKGFAGWLIDTASRAGVTSSSQLQRVLVRQGLDVTEGTVARWWKGTHLPPGRQMQAVIAALSKAFPEIDVWGSYTEYMRQGGFRPTPRGAGVVTPLRPRPS